MRRADPMNPEALLDIELTPLAAAARPDADEFLHAVLESKTSLMRWMPWCHVDYSSHDVESWFESADQMWSRQSAFPMLIRSKASGALLGGAGLHDVLLYGKREADLGYWVRASARGQGVASTAIRAIAAFAFKELKLARASIRIRLENGSSRRAAERAGASFEGVARHGLVQGEARFDAAQYSLLPSDLSRPWSR
ncbi:MAG: GNAT family N-acetyltransferase [Burkholderiaceae bacterium]|nr:GNAT family N-acetyltransferase [Burkholderiaceae bacterium]